MSPVQLYDSLLPVHPIHLVPFSTGFTAGRCQYKLQAFPDAAVEVLSFQLSGQLVVYATVSAQAPRRRQLLLPQLHHATVTASKAACAYATIIDRLTIWTVNTVYACNGQPPPLGLMALPEGVLARVLGNLQYTDLLACAQVCRALQEAASDDVVWCTLWKEDFGEGAGVAEVWCPSFSCHCPSGPSLASLICCLLLNISVSLVFTTADAVDMEQSADTETSGCCALV
jgi:hypothetical protein